MMNPRWRVLGVVVALLIAAITVDARNPILREITPVVGALKVPLVAPTDAASSTWYCAAGTIGAWLPPVSEEEEEAVETWEPEVGVEGEDTGGVLDDHGGRETDSEGEAGPNGEAGEAGEGEAGNGDDAEAEEAPPEVIEDVATGPIEANQTLILANPTSEERQAVISISVATEPVVVIERTLKPSTVERVSLSEYGDATISAALVEIDGGGVAVSQALEGPLGKELGACVSTTSDVWYFADGITTRDSRYVMSLFNPFPGDAVVDFTIRTPDGVREPKGLTGVIVPGHSVVAVDVGAEVTRREHLATTVRARSGQIVAQRWQTFNGALGHRGILMQRGVVTAPLVNAFALGRKDDNYRQDLMVYNPTEQTAQVDVSIVDTPETAGAIDPFELTLEPGTFRVLNLSEEPRILDAIGADSAEFAVIVRSVNNVAVLSELTTFANDPGGVSSSLGSPGVSSQQLVLNPGSLSSRSNRLRIFNPGNAELDFSMELVEGGLWRSLPEAQISIAPGTRATVNLDELNLGAAVFVLNGSGGFVAELVTTVTNETDLLVRAPILTEAGLETLQ